MFKSFYYAYLLPVRSFNRSARLFLLMTIINGIIFSSWSLFFNFFMLQSGYDRAFLGLVNAIPSVAALIFGIPIGWLSDRLGRKTSMILGMALASVAMVLQVTARDPNLILAMAFFSGVSNTLFIVSQAPLMMKLSDARNRTLLFSLNFGLATLAGSVGNLFAGQLPAIFGAVLNVDARSAVAYQAVLVASVLLGSTALVPLFGVQESGKIIPAGGQLHKRSLQDLRPIAATTLHLAAPQVLIGFGAAILIPYMNVFFLDKFAIPDSQLGLMFSLSALLTGVGSLVGPRLALHLGGKIRAVVVTQFSSLIFLLTIGFSPLLWLAAVGFLARGALMNMAAPLYSAFCMEQIPERDQGLVNSILSLSWQLGWAVGPYLSGVVQEIYGFTPLFIATATLYFLAILLTWLFFQRTPSEFAPELQPAGADSR